MQIYQTSTDLHNFCRTFSDDVSKPQMKRLKELMHGIILGQEGILSEVARQNRHKEKKTVRKQVEQYSNMLLKFPLEIMMIRKLIGLKSQINKGDALYFDLVDITKKYHKSMEDIGATWDGSEGVAAKGYEMVDVSLGRNEGGMSLYRHLYSTKNLDYASQVKEIEKVFKVLIAAWGEMRGTSFVDMGGDNDRLIGLFLDYEASFAIRMNVNRGKQDRIVFDEDGEETRMMDLWGKIQGFTVWNDAKKKKKKIVQLQWKKIFLKRKKEFVPMHMVWSHREGDPNPCVFLTSRNIENESEAKNVYHQYFQRGGKEEALFKCGKAKLGMEKVQLCSFEKVKQLMCIYVLIDQFLTKLNEAAREAGNLLHTFLRAFLQGAQRKITKWSIIDFYYDNWTKMERQILLFRSGYSPPPAKNQLSLYSLTPEKW